MNDFDIKRIRITLGVSQEEFAKRLAVSLRTIQNWEAGKVIPSSKHAILRNMESGAMLSVENMDSHKNVSESRGKLIPFYDAEVAAGVDYGMDMESTRQTGLIEIGSILYDSESAIRVYGNSMVPNYPAGCVIGVKFHSDSFIEPGRVYVVETDDNRYLKRLYYNDDRNAFHCLSDNQMKYDDGPREGKPYYQDFEIPLASVRKLFRVVGVIKRNIL